MGGPKAHDPQARLAQIMTFHRDQTKLAQNALSRWRGPSGQE
eukprot:NODE_8319_length_245_cov_52.056122_g7704_i0.p2 GENE.NODE_8319_length_245_cov_52.056122_g7704_i0~~NODE_8319_length_245_cov_52.056122_g7704_i0.p2  ORF type:complete len:51 (+),score=21.73 NODE_8319_length_245_cov_52.056122_g7704_i0:29-154(+)